MTAPARAVAARVLERVARDDAFADLVLDAELTRRRVDPRDAALATELVYGTLRWQRYLDWIVAPHSRTSLGDLDPNVRVILRLTAYQIVFLDRIPAWAAVNDAVELAGRKPGVGGFVNAVLRSFVRRGMPEREPAPSRDPLEALATRSSFPTWLAARWTERFGTDEATALMKALNERPPLTVRVNTQKLTREELAARLEREEGLRAQPTRYASDGLTVDYGGSPADWRAFTEGAFAVQDEASMLIAHLLDPRPGETVADVCAAPGTKTTHLAQLMHDAGRLLAFDPDPRRLERVRDAVDRLGLRIVETRAEAAEVAAEGFGDTCDAVLVDAPCTNLGVLRRHPEIKWRRQPHDITAAAHRQRGILQAAARMVKPGGRLVYATCSLEPEENEAITAELLAGGERFAVDPPAAFPLPLDPGGVLRCLPHHHGTDGFTAVRLRRVL